MPDETTLLEKADQVASIALEAGADHADAYIRSGPATRITFQHSHVNENEGWQQELALRVWCGDKQALLATSDISPAGLRHVARQAVAEARWRGEAIPPLLQGAQHIVPISLSEEPVVPVAEKRAMVERLAATISSRSLSRTMLSASYLETQPEVALVNSRGFRAAYQERNYRLWVWVEGRGGHLVEATSGRRFAALAPEMLAKQIHERLVLLDEPMRKAPAGPCEVLLPPLAAAGLVRTLGIMLTAEKVLKELAVLTRRINLPFASPAVTLIDDGTRNDGFSSRPFDDEGTPTGLTTLVEEGNLRGFLHTLQSAARLGVPPNGKATRSALWRQPHSAASNLYLRPGSASPGELRHQVQRGIVVTNMLRSGQIQGTGGKFTLIVQGWWVEHGELAYRVNFVPLSANIFALLRAIRACGSDLEFPPLAGGVGAPSLLIERMQVD